jgi:hypothetical protein
VTASIREAVSQEAFSCAGFTDQEQEFCMRQTASFGQSANARGRDLRRLREVELLQSLDTRQMRIFGGQIDVPPRRSAALQDTADETGSAGALFRPVKRTACRSRTDAATLSIARCWVFPGLWPRSPNRRVPDQTESRSAADARRLTERLSSKTQLARAGVNRSSADVGMQRCRSIPAPGHG